MAVNYSSGAKGLWSALIALFSTAGGLYMLVKVLWSLCEFMLGPPDDEFLEESDTKRGGGTAELSQLGRTAGIPDEEADQILEGKTAL